MDEQSTVQFRKEGENPFANTESDTSAESPTENNDSEPTQTSDGEENSDAEQQDTESQQFDKHPRWKEREDDWKNRFNEQEKRHVDEINKLREEMTSFRQKPEESKSGDIPQWFGGDERQWQEFQEWNKSLVEQAEQNALKTVEQKKQEEQKAIDEATQYFNDQVDSIESDQSINPKGLKVDRNKLLKYALDNDLVDSKGRWNYVAAWRLMQANIESKETDTLNARKKVASSTTSERHSETKPPSYMTSKDFSNPSNRPW